MIDPVRRTQNVDTSMRVVFTPAPVRRQVAEIIRSAITSGRFAPGQRLIEKELCELTGVSRPSVREALRQLETDGLIEVIPHKGPSVSRLTREGAAGIYQVRGALEALAAQSFAIVATDAEIAQLRQAVTALKAAYATQEVEQILVAKHAFYQVLFDGAGNPTIPALLRTLTDRITLLRRVTLSSPSRAAASMAEIDVILDAIERRDAASAHAATLHHISEASKSALGALDP
ncbi:MAG TPA: GntR family transcriptional regulator [Tianweitania sediminis]|nr:GntR family transcriptional regulator [Tianweitania sediminis]